jgi:site-specific recombinase XerD
VASIPTELTTTTSLTAAASDFHGFMIRQGFSDNTIKAFQADLRLLMRFMGNNQCVGEIGQANLEQFLTWIRADRGTPCSPKSYARRVTTLKVFFGWLTKEKVLAEDPAAGLVHEHPQTRMPELLYDSQVHAALRVAQDMLWAAKHDARPYLLLSTIYQTAIKKSECVGIKLDHIDASNTSAPVLYIRYEDARKALKERRLALGPAFMPAYRQYLREYSPKEYLFECTARNLEYVLADLAQRAEISHGISFEQVRWTAAVRDYRNGMPPDQLRQKLGLSQISWRETLPKLQRLARPPL